MEKTKLGISVGLLGAALYFTGIFNFIVLILLAGYVLIFETNEWLRKSALKAVIVVIIFSIVSTLIGISNNILSILNIPLSLIRIPFRLSWPFGIDSILLNILSIAEKLLLLLLGFTAFSQGSLSLGPIDKIIDKNV